MSDGTEKFDLLSVAGLGRRKSRPDKKYASLNRRMMAATVDSLLLMFTTPLVDEWLPVHGVEMQALPDPNNQEAARRWLVDTLFNSGLAVSWLDNAFAQMLIFCFFSAICWHFWAATPGKMLLRIKIVDANTEKPISDQQILLRIFGYMISTVIFMLGIVWISFDKRRQGWHDKIADTVVIVVPVEI